MNLGRIFVLAAIVVLGALILSPAVRMMDLGALPGDVTLRFGTTHIFLPLMSSLILSLLLGLLFWVLKK